LPPSIRDLVWDGCLNVRDLGGHPTEDGGETRFGRIVRADSVRQLSDEGWKALVNYGIARIVDLRWHEELEADPPRELPVEVVHVPLFGARTDTAAIDKLIEPLEDTSERRRVFYLETLLRFPGNYAAAITAVAQAPEGGLVVHCAGGVDRTGLVSALILRLAGVGVDAIGEDYAVSERNLAAFRERWIDEAPDEDERRWRRLWSAIPAQVMVDVLDELERRHGSVSSYLREGGAAPGALDRVRARLRG
jgi:protein tyrosine/serine phosphatase